MSKTTSNTSIVKSEDLTQIEQVPDFLKNREGQPTGMEQVESSDIQIPRLGLCQSLSPQRKKTHQLYIPGLEEGQLFNNVTNEIYGDTIEVYLLFFFKNRIKFNPIDDGGGMDCISPNAIDMGRHSPDGCSVCKFSKFGNGSTEEDEVNEPPMCTLYHNFMSLLPGHGMSPIAISFKATGLKITKQFLATLRLSGLPMFAKKYEIKVVTQKKGELEWFEKKVTDKGFVDQALFKQLEEHYKMLKEANYVVSDRGEEGDAEFHAPAGNEAY